MILKPSLIFTLLLLQFVSAQSGGHGISKSTWGSSKPHKCLAFFKKYLPVVDSPDGCKDQQCECATQGRVQVEPTSPGGGFGLHTINCTYHPYGDYPLEYMEGAIQDAVGNWSTYQPFMDYNTAFWSYDINSYISDFQKDGVNFLPLKWKSDDGKMYYSILFPVCGYVHLEIVSDTVSSDYLKIFQAHDKPRIHFNERSNMPTEKTKYLTPLQVSRGTYRMDELKAFYTEDIGAVQMKNEKYDDGSEVLVVGFVHPKQIVHVAFW